MSLSVIVLAAGKGTRMRSSLSKVLHTLAGKTLIERVLNSAYQLNPSQVVVVYGHQGETLKAALNKIFPKLEWALQAEPQGTAHAVLQALALIPDNHQVLILSADVPLISAVTLQRLIDETPEPAMGMITAVLSEPAGLGRIVRDHKNAVIRVVEEKDASVQEKTIQEVNSNIFYIKAALLKRWLPSFQANNQQKEYYLPDLVSASYREKLLIHVLAPTSAMEIEGINDKLQLANLERKLQRQLAEDFMLKGVTILDPNRLDIRGEVEIEADVTLDINIILEGRVVIKSGARIGPQCVLKNCTVEKGAIIKAHSLIDGAHIGPFCEVGPFARLRPGTVLAEASRIGNFVEIKQATVGKNSKINHLSYVGDATIGQDVNVGAGTITCNYNGVIKQQTIIEDGAFIGVHVQLVAPVRVGTEATIGAGTTLTKDAPAQQLTLSRAPLRTVADWVSPLKRQDEK